MASVQIVTQFNIISTSWTRTHNHFRDEKGVGVLLSQWQCHEILTKVSVVSKVMNHYTNHIIRYRKCPIITYGIFFTTFFPEICIVEWLMLQTIYV